jgi:hypothetical protein
MEDEHGPINAIVAPRIYEECRGAIRLEPFLLIDGTLQKDGDTFNVIVSSVQALRLEPERDLSVQPELPRGLDVSAPRGRVEGFSYLEALRKDSPPALSWGRGGGCR